MPAAMTVLAANGRSGMESAGRVRRARAVSTASRVWRVTAKNGARMPAVTARSGVRLPPAVPRAIGLSAPPARGFPRGQSVATPGRAGRASARAERRGPKRAGPRAADLARAAGSSLGSSLGSSPRVRGAAVRRMPAPAAADRAAAAPRARARAGADRSRGRKAARGVESPRSLISLRNFGATPGDSPAAAPVIRRFRGWRGCGPAEPGPRIGGKRRRAREKCAASCRSFPSGDAKLPRCRLLSAAAEPGCDAGVGQYATVAADPLPRPSVPLF